jgi:lipoyl(octanoyl) transferase
MQELWVVRCGVVPYEEARALQKAVEAARLAGEVPDVLLVLEHPPVYTRGRRATPDELPMGDEWYRLQGIEIADTDRGGRTTYHGPGQLVAYPIVALRELAKPDDVHRYVRLLERAMISTLADWEIEAGLFEGLTGVWVGVEPPPAGDARKIGSIGIHVNRGVATHGLAINVNNDLQPFEWAVPCGIEAVRMTSLARELGAEQDLDAFAATLTGRLGEVFEREPVEAPAERLAGAAPVR